VSLVPSGSGTENIFTNAIGQYSGETASLVDEGEYILDVDADGDWSITVRQPRAKSGESPPVSLSDSSNQVYGPFEFEGTSVATGSHSGDSNFVVEVYPVNGIFQTVVFNEIGTFDGETTFNFNGVGYIAVQGNGEWSLSIK
jgi:hypothetical protein